MHRGTEVQAIVERWNLYLWDEGVQRGILLAISVGRNGGRFRIRGSRHERGMRLALIVGVILAVAVGLLGTFVGFERDRAFYSTVLIVVASYYALFAIVGGSTHALVLEALVGGAFLLAAVIGFRTSMWVVAVGLAGHGIFDMVHGGIIANPGLPDYWPAFCAAFDVVAGGYLAWVIGRGRVAAAARF